MSTKRAHKHVQEMMKRLAHRDDDVYGGIRTALEAFTPEECLAVMQLYSKNRAAVEALMVYARRYKVVLPELSADELREIQNYIITQAVHNS